MRFLSACLLLSCVSVARGDDLQLHDRATQALRKTCDAYRERVSTEGGYLWQYSADLKAREGEVLAGDTTVWVQPPGTPSVGQALLEVYLWTRDEHYLQLARDAAECLRRGQLESGGWDYRIEFTPAERKNHAYRTDGGKGRRNTTTLDDNTTQEALRFLMRLDAVLAFKDEKLHESITYALDQLLAAQYPNGAFPQRFSAPPDADQYPVRRAEYPDTWSRTWSKHKYLDYYTFNDNALADVVDVLFMAHTLYQDEKYRAAVLRAGDFLLLAQMPDPQPGWAQQYNAQMHPAWARKFEPPAVTGGESQGVMRLLLRMYEMTGQRKYLDAVGRALPYYQKCVLADGRLARFYELQTNKPLYFTKDYKLVYTDDDMPTHYAFKVGSKLDRIERDYDRLKQATPEQLQKAADAWARPWVALKSQPPLDPQELARRLRPKIPSNRDVRQLLDSLDDRSLWVEPGELKHTPGVKRVIRSQTFATNIVLLARYVGLGGA